jgi:hypothetical protein
MDGWEGNVEQENVHHVPPPARSGSAGPPSRRFYSFRRHKMRGPSFVRVRVVARRVSSGLLSTCCVVQLVGWKDCGAVDVLETWEIWIEKGLETESKRVEERRLGLESESVTEAFAW